MGKLALLLEGFKGGFKGFQHIIAQCINFVFLLLAYCIGVGIVSLYGKISRRTFLELKSDKKDISYWKPLNLKKVPKEEYYRQF